jgi:hypothetical protein
MAMMWHSEVTSDSYNIMGIHFSGNYKQPESVNHIIAQCNCTKVRIESSYHNVLLFVLRNSTPKQIKMYKIIIKV